MTVEFWLSICMSGYQKVCKLKQLIYENKICRENKTTNVLPVVKMQVKSVDN